MDSPTPKEIDAHIEARAREYTAPGDSKYPAMTGVALAYLQGLLAGTLSLDDLCQKIRQHKS